MTFPSTESGLGDRIRRLSRRSLILGLACGVALTTAAGAIAGVGHGGGWHHGGMSVQAMSSHADQFLPRVYAELGVSDAQKAQLDPIVKQALADLAVEHSRPDGNQAFAVEFLNNATVDRAALEALREAHVERLDRASRRVAQLVGDVAEVLTPAQRQALAARILQRHGALPEG